MVMSFEQFQSSSIDQIVRKCQGNVEPSRRMAWQEWNDSQSSQRWYAELARARLQRNEQEARRVAAQRERSDAFQRQQQEERDRKEKEREASIARSQEDARTEQERFKKSGEEAQIKCAADPACKAQRDRMKEVSDSLEALKDLTLLAQSDLLAGNDFLSAPLQFSTLVAGTVVGCQQRSMIEALVQSIQSSKPVSVSERPASRLCSVWKAWCR
jgi:hypothetical protein